jgi:hypothetical protein
MGPSGWTARGGPSSKTVTRGYSPAADRDDKRVLLHRNFRSPADSAQFPGNGTGSGFTALSSIGDLVSRHRYHRRNRDAPQPVPALCPGTEPQATEGRTIYPERDPLQRH